MATLLQVASRVRKFTPSHRAAAVSGVRSGLMVMSTAARLASPGGIAREIGFRLLAYSGPLIVQGIVGLGVGAGGKAPRPHGFFLESGTKYIRARRFVRNAIAGARSSARTAMKNATKRTIHARWKARGD